MSNRSRARYRSEVADDEVVDPDEAERIAEAQAAMENPDKKAGLASLVDVVMRSRDTGSTPKTAEPAAATPDTAARTVDPDAVGLREPTPYEAAILFALGNRTTVIDRSHVGGRCFEVPVSIASGGMYGGTVEPERVAARRRRNKAARAARRGNRRRTFGRVYQSRFGYPIHVPGITPPVDAEVVDA